MSTAPKDMAEDSSASPAQEPTPTPAPTQKRKPPLGGVCAVCGLPDDLRAQVNEMILGTPGDPNAMPPRPATWTTPMNLSIWLHKLTPSRHVSVDSIRYHQREHLKISRARPKTTNFVANLSPSSPPPLPPKFEQVSQLERKEETNAFTLPAKTTGQKRGPRPKATRELEKSQPPPLEHTKLLDPPTDEGDVTTFAPMSDAHQVMDGPALEDDKLDQLALAPPKPNADLAYVELALREMAKTHASFSREIRRRPNKTITQPEVMLLVGGMQAISAGLRDYRQVMMVTKGGRFGVPETMDQRRGLKNMLHSQRAIIPGDMAPKDAEPVGVPVPIADKLAPPMETLPLNADALPEKVTHPPPITLDDLSSPAAPASSPRPTVAAPPPSVVSLPMAVGDGRSGAPGPAANGQMTNALAPGGQMGEVRAAGGTVTPIKKWDSVV